MSKKITKNKSKTIIKKIIDNEIAPYKPDFSTTWYEEIYYWFYRKCSWVWTLPQEIKWRWQRSKRGYADCDLWGLDSYLSEWLPKALRQLSKDISGCPQELWDKSNKKNQCWKWSKIIREMANGFEAAQDIIDLKYVYKGGKINEKKYKKLKSKFEKGMQLFSKYFFGLWD